MEGPQPPSLPDALRERLSRLVGDPEALVETLHRPRRDAFRVNTLKADPDRTLRRLQDQGVDLEPVPWAPHAYRTDADLGTTMAHFLGHVYVQSAVSMLPPLAVADEVAGACVLDGCAAPGSKTTQLAALMEDTGLLVANDKSWGRIAALKHNLDRVGATNQVITQEDLGHVGWDPRFDVALVDAPCSSEGILRKTYSPLDHWSIKAVKGRSGIQRQMALRAFDLLVPGGALVYSTCTFGPEEDEAVVDHVLRERDGADVEPLAFDGLETRPGVTAWEGRTFDDRVADAVRVWPHHNDTDGFFLAKVRKVEA